MSKSALVDSGHIAHSYATCIKDVLNDGRSIGNDTKYSSTASHHQSKALVRACDVVVTGVPMGTNSLAAWYNGLTAEEKVAHTGKRK